MEVYAPVPADAGRNDTEKAAILNYATGCHACGDTEKALRLSETLLGNPFKNNENLIQMAFVYSNLAMFYLQAEDVEKAEEAVQKAGDVLHRYPGDARYEAFELQVLNAEYRLKLAKGDMGGVAEYYEHLLLHAKNRYAAVSAHYVLAKVCERTGEAGKPKEHLTFVAQNGGTLYCAKKAAKMLRAMNANA